VSGAYSRNKGARAERELCTLLTDWLGEKFTRELKQYQQAQHGDIAQLVGPYLVECKNQKTLALSSWWQQARCAAKVAGAVPCVAYRLANRPLEDRWRFLVPIPAAYAGGHEWGTDYRYTADVGIDGFALLCREGG
jgi:hypothetical protein